MPAKSQTAPRAKRSALAELDAAPAEARAAFLGILADANARKEQSIEAAGPDASHTRAIVACRPISQGGYRRAVRPTLREVTCDVVASEPVPAETMGTLVGKSWGKAFNNISSIYLDLELLTGQLVRVLVFESGKYDWRNAPYHYLYALEFGTSKKGYLNVKCFEEPELPLTALVKEFPTEQHGLFYDQQAWVCRPLVIEKGNARDLRDQEGRERVQKLIDEGKLVKHPYQMGYMSVG